MSHTPQSAFTMNLFKHQDQQLGDPTSNLLDKASCSTFFHELFHLVLGSAATIFDGGEAYGWDRWISLTASQAVANSESYVLAALAYMAKRQSSHDLREGLIEYVLRYATRGPVPPAVREPGGEAWEVPPAECQQPVYIDATGSEVDGDGVLDIHFFVPSCDRAAKILEMAGTRLRAVGSTVLGPRSQPGRAVTSVAYRCPPISSTTRLDCVFGRTCKEPFARDFKRQGSALDARGR